MKIYVNDQDIEATLTGEKNLEEVYGAVNDWVSASKRYILSLQVDKKDVALSTLGGIGAEEIERLDFYVGDQFDMLLKTLGEMDAYVDQVGGILFERQEISPEGASNLQDGIRWISQILESFSSIIGTDLHSLLAWGPDRRNGEPMDRLLGRLSKRAQSLQEASGPKEIEGFLADLRLLRHFIKDIDLQLRSISADDNELLAMIEEFQEEIPALSHQLVSINENFNRGSDEKALGILEQCSARLNGFIAAMFAIDYRLRRKGEQSIMDLSVESVSFHLLASELTASLQQLSLALEQNDIVAVGDVLEYELTDKLTRILPYLTEIRQLMLDSSKSSQ